jgi:hypothetical protein
MIYSNEEQHFYRADGRTQEKIALRNLGKLLKQRKNTLIEVLKSEGIKLPRKAKPKQLIRVIKQHARNKNLRKKLAIMMLWDKTLDKEVDKTKSGFIGDKKDGTERTGLNLGNLFKKNPDKVKGEGWKKFKSVFAKDPDKEKKKWGDTNLGSKFNSIFKGGTDEEGNETQSKFGGFLSGNSDFLKDLGGSLLGGLLNKNAEKEIEDSVDNTMPPSDKNQNQDNQREQGGVNMKTIALIGGGLLLVGGVIYAVVKSRKK